MSGACHVSTCQVNSGKAWTSKNERVVPSYFMIAWKHSDTDIFAMWQCFHTLLLPLACAAHFWRTHFQKVSIFAHCTSRLPGYDDAAQWNISNIQSFSHHLKHKLSIWQNFIWKNVTRSIILSHFDPETHFEFYASWWSRSQIKAI